MPGKHEDKERIPFVGKAGILNEEYFNEAGLYTKDFWVTNCVLCRPIATKGSGRENLTPKMKQRRRCKPYLELQIDLIKPRLIVTLGKIAAETILGKKEVKSMGAVRGKIYEINLFSQQEKTIVFPVLHPAALLHSQRDPDKHKIYTQQFTEDINKLKSLIIERRL